MNSEEIKSIYEEIADKLNVLQSELLIDFESIKYGDNISKIIRNCNSCFGQHMMVNATSYIFLNYTLIKKVCDADEYYKFRDNSFFHPKNLELSIITTIIHEFTHRKIELYKGSGFNLKAVESFDDLVLLLDRCDMLENCFSDSITKNNNEKSNSLKEYNYHDEEFFREYNSSLIKCKDIIKRYEEKRYDTEDVAIKWAF